MPDRFLVIFFGTLTAIALIVGSIGVFFAVRAARKNESELKMAAWSVVALTGLTFAGMCTAYFLLPILANHLFR